MTHLEDDNVSVTVTQVQQIQIDSFLLSKRIAIVQEFTRVIVSRSYWCVLDTSEALISRLRSVRPFHPLV